MKRLLFVVLALFSVTLSSLAFFVPRAALAASITCSGDVLATVEFDTPAVNEYRLNGTGPGLPTEILISSDSAPESFSWLLPGPGSWDVALDWRRPPTVPDWSISMYDSLVQLTCFEVPTPSPTMVLTTEPLPGPLALNLLDGRINNSQVRDIAAPVAVYCVDGNIEVWRVDPFTSQGTLVLSHPQITGLPEGGNTELASAQGITLYWLEDGRYQLNAPNFEGNLYSITWEGCDSRTLLHLAS